MMNFFPKIFNLFSFFSIEKRPCPSFEPAWRAGEYGERVAGAFLRRQGYKILTRNYESGSGEIDLVCRHDGTLVFVEVKARDESTMKRPAKQVTYQKRQKIIRTAHAYLNELPARDVPARFDVVEVYLKPGEPPKCELLPSAFAVR